MFSHTTLEDPDSDFAFVMVTHVTTAHTMLVCNSLGLDVGLLSHSVGDLLAVVVLLLGFDQLFD